MSGQRSTKAFFSASDLNRLIFIVVSLVPDAFLIFQLNWLVRYASVASSWRVEVLEPVARLRLVSV